MEKGWSSLRAFNNESSENTSRGEQHAHSVRTRKAKKETVYYVPGEISVPAIDTALASLVTDIDYNDNLVVIKTTPGAAQIIARLLDSLGKADGILGCVGGKDVTAHFL